MSEDDPQPCPKCETSATFTQTPTFTDIGGNCGDEDKTFNLDEEGIVDFTYKVAPGLNQDEEVIFKASLRLHTNDDGICGEGSGGDEPCESAETEEDCKIVAELTLTRVSNRPFTVRLRSLKQTNTNCEGETVVVQDKTPNFDIIGLQMGAASYEMVNWKCAETTEYEICLVDHDRDQPTAITCGTVVLSCAPCCGEKDD